MSKIEDDDAVQQTVRMLQIIVGALAFGVVFFWALITLVLPNAEKPAEPEMFGLPLITALSCAFGAGSVAASLIVPKLMTDGALRQIAKGVPFDQTRPTASGQRQIYPATDVGRLLPVFSTELIVASALNEGAAFFGALAYMMEGHAASLLGSAVLVALLLSRFPSVERVQTWLEAQLERLAVKRRDDF